MKRTKFGLTLTFENGEWVSPDGHAIGRVRAIEFCDGPHPERYRQGGTGQWVTGYCYGGEEHDHEIGWDIRQHGNTPRGMADDLFSTLTEAWESLADHLAKQASRS